MCRSYIESYKDLYHGTTEPRAVKIVDTQTFIPSEKGWCGSGVYFYDNKAKAWWSAKRTCRNEKLKGNKPGKAGIVIADIKPLKRAFILDLRSPDDLKRFADFVDEFLQDDNFEIEEEISEDQCLKYKRAMLLSFFCKENGRKLIIGYFKQEAQEKIDSTRKFADSWELAVGIETIYCAKDTSIIENIRRR